MLFDVGFKSYSAMTVFSQESNVELYAQMIIGLIIACIFIRINRLWAVSDVKIYKLSLYF